MLDIKTIRLKDRDFGDQWENDITDRWEYSDFLANDEWRKDWISFDCLCYYGKSDIVFAGLTSFDADIFWGWSRSDKRWVDTGYNRIRDKYDAKFHRSLVLNPKDGCIYAGTALLHDIDRFWDAPGGAFVRYNPSTGDIVKLATPIPHVYIQSMVLDESRQILYAQTFTPENLVSYNIRTGESRWIGPTSSGLTMAQGQSIGLDNEGNVWGVWHVTRAWQMDSGVDSVRLYKYNPNTERIEFLNKGLPRPDGAYGYVNPEAFFNLGTGCLYISGGKSGLYRLDTKTGDAEFLFKAVENRPSRLSAMSLAPDGFAYGVTGSGGQCDILQFNPSDETYKLIGELKESSTGVSAYQIHDVCITPDNVLYAGESENLYRSSYLWEVRL